jgi:hypothetical protein
MTTDYEAIRQTIRERLDAMGVSIRFEYAGYTEERKHSFWVLWKGTIVKDGREVYSFDYGHGIGHIKGLNPNPKTIRDFEQIRSLLGSGMQMKLHAPKGENALSCLVSDADAIDYPTFEEWASEFGYDADSRKAEAIYRKCVETGLALRRIFGESGLNELRELTREL